LALSRIKTWIAGEVLTASDLNAEYNNLLNNALTLISPLTGPLDIDGQTLTLDAAAATQVVSSAAVSWSFTSGAKTGTPGTGGSVERFSAQTFTDSATAGSGTATAAVFYSIAAPTLAATNASVVTTDAATWYIAAGPIAGTNETITNGWSIWADAGNVRFDDDIHWLSGQTFAQRGILAHANTGIRTYTFGDQDSRVGIVLGTAQATTSGTAFDFTVPTGTKRVSIKCAGVSLSGTDHILVQIGPAAGVETTGYLSTSANSTPSFFNGTTGFFIYVGSAAQLFSGRMVLELLDSSINSWVETVTGKLDSTVLSYGGGDKAIAGPLINIRVTRTGTNTFDTGAVNISYE